MCLAQLIFPGITFEIHINVKIVAVYKIIKLTEKKVIYLEIFKCAATRPEFGGYVIAFCSIKI